MYKQALGSAEITSKIEPKVLQSKIGKDLMRSHIFLSKKAGVWLGIIHGLLNRWMSQLDLECTTGGLERVVSVHNST